MRRARDDYDGRAPFEELVGHPVAGLLVDACLGCCFGQHAGEPQHGRHPLDGDAHTAVLRPHVEVGVGSARFPRAGAA